MNNTITVWNITNETTLEQIREELKSVNNTEEIPEWNGDGLISKVSCNIEKDCDDNKIYTIDIGEITYRYLSFNIYTERKKIKKRWYDEEGNLKNHKDRINPIQSDMLIYEKENKLFLVAFSAKTTVNKLDRYILKKIGIVEIEEYNLDICEDMFYWILKSLRDYPGEPLHNESKLIPTGLWSYLGKTSDGNNSIRADGRRILAVLGTLAVIFSSEELKAVKPEFQKDNQIVVLEINLNNSLKIDDGDCMGSIFNIYENQQQRLNSIALYTINEIIPEIIESYNKSIRDDMWSKELKIDFISSMGAEIKNRVELELESLKCEDESE